MKKWLRYLQGINVLLLCAKRRQVSQGSMVANLFRGFASRPRERLLSYHINVSLRKVCVNKEISVVDTSADGLSHHSKLLVLRDCL